MEAIPCALCERPAIVRCTQCGHYVCGTHSRLICPPQRVGEISRGVRAYCAGCLCLLGSKIAE
jgi:hypothetical protein